MEGFQIRQHRSLGALSAARIAAAVLILAVLGFAPLAVADNDQRARELYLAGEDDYAAGRYEDAADKFEEAYRLSKRPALLFNLGNTYERMGEYERAVKVLEMYLDSPDPQRVRETRQRIDNLRKRAEDKRQREEELRKLRDGKAEGGDKTGTGDRDSGTTGGGTSVEVEPDDPEPQGPSRLPSYLLIGGGGAVLAAGVFFALGSSSAGSDAEAHCMSSGGARFCSADAKSDLDREKTYGLLADVSFVVGLAAVTTGVILWVTADQPDPEEEELSWGPTLVPGGGGVGVMGRF